MDRGFPDYVSDAEIERIGVDALRKRIAKLEEEVAKLRKVEREFIDFKMLVNATKDRT